jgi:hypothetical protein
MKMELVAEHLREKEKKWRTGGNTKGISKGNKG